MPHYSLWSAALARYPMSVLTPAPVYDDDEESSRTNRKPESEFESNSDSSASARPVKASARAHAPSPTHSPLTSKDMKAALLLQ